MALTADLRTHVLDGISKGFEAFGYKMTPDDITGKDRQRVYIKARRIACYILRNSYHHDVTSIGNALNIDHSTVTYHCKTADHELEMYFDMAELYRRSVAYIGCNIPTWITLCTEPKKFIPAPTPRASNRVSNPERKGEWVKPMHWNQKKKADLAAWRKYQGL